MKHYGIGILAGEEKVRTGIFDLEGQKIAAGEFPVRKGMGCRPLLELASDDIRERLLENNISRDQVLGIGLCLPAEVSKKGVVHYCQQLGWGIVNVKELLEQITGFPVTVGCSRDMAALGELYSRKEYFAENEGLACNMLSLLLGEDLEGSLILNRRLVCGSSGRTRDIGGLRFLWELPGKIGSIYQEETKSKQKEARSKQKEIKSDWHETMDSVFDAFMRNDPLAMKLMYETARSIAMGIGRTHQIAELDMVVLGGVKSAWSQWMAEEIRRQYYKLDFDKMLDIQLTRLGEDAPLLGSAVDVMEVKNDRNK